MAKRFPHLVVVWVEGCGKTLFSQGRVSKKEGKVWYFAATPPPPSMVFFWEFFLPKFVLLEISSQRGETNVTLGPISKIIFFFVHWYSPSFPQDLGPSGYFQSCSKKVVWIFNYPTGMAKSHTFPYFFCGTLPLGWSINMFCVSVISGVNWVQTSSLQSHRIFRAFASLFNLEHIQKDSPPTPQTSFSTTSWLLCDRSKPSWPPQVSCTWYGI